MCVCLCVSGPGRGAEITFSTAVKFYTPRHRRSQSLSVTIELKLPLSIGPWSSFRYMTGRSNRSALRFYARRIHSSRTKRLFQSQWAPGSLILECNCSLTMPLGRWALLPCRLFVSTGWGEAQLQLKEQNPRFTSVKSPLHRSAPRMGGRRGQPRCPISPPVLNFVSCNRHGVPSTL